MHHPDICDVLLSIQDFMLLVDDRTNCEIIPQPTYCNDLAKEPVYVKQICIRRKLSFGWLEIIIQGLGSDSNLISCEYLTGLEPRLCIESTEILWKHYSIDRVRDAIREILILDKKSTIEKTKQLAPATY
jgi:hypothetical protein